VRRRGVGRVVLRLATATMLVAGLGFSAMGIAQAGVAPRPSGVVRVAAPTQGLPIDWVVRGSGQFETSDPVDLLEYQVVSNAVPQSVVEFRLESSKRCHWGKTLVMPDGQGRSWPIHIDPSRGIFSASDSLWAGQVHNGQHLELWKAGFLGFEYHVLDIGDLGPIQPGSRVVFTWLRDSRTC
jgi:hypothetical protein